MGLAQQRRGGEAAGGAKKSTAEREERRKWWWGERRGEEGKMGNGKERKLERAELAREGEKEGGCDGSADGRFYTFLLNQGNRARKGARS